MAQTVRAAVMVAPGRTELQSFPMPSVSADDAVLRVEACGVCGSDPGIYRRGAVLPAILGHEIAGTIEAIGDGAAAKWGLRAGDRVAVEEYLPCWNCAWCAKGEYRLCDQAQILVPGSIRLGYAPTTLTPALWGGFAEFLYLHPHSVLHKIPADMPAHRAALAVPLSNGVQWCVAEGGAGPGKTVLVVGPGQQGLGAAVAARDAGAARIIVCGLAQDARRLEVARLLGADVTINAEDNDLKTSVLDATGGCGVDVVVDTTGDTSGQVAAMSIAVAAKGATLVLNGAGIIPLAIHEIKRKYLGIRPVRGHSYASVEHALRIAGSGAFDLDAMCSHHYGLADVHTAIAATKGDGYPGAIHVDVRPWSDH